MHLRLLANTTLVLLVAVTVAGQAARPFRPPIKASLPVSGIPCDDGTEFDASQAATWYSVVWTGRYGCAGAADAALRKEGSGGHPGVDIRGHFASDPDQKKAGADLGIYPIGDGVLRFVGPVPGWGNVVVVEHHGVVGHGKLYSVYAHLAPDEFLGKTKSGEPCLTRIAAGDRLGTMGSSGTDALHLHFQVDRRWERGKKQPFWPAGYPSLGDCATPEKWARFVTPVKENTVSPMWLVENGRHAPASIVGEPGTDKEAFAKAYKEGGSVAELGCASGPVLKGFTSFSGTVGYYQQLDGGLLQFHSGRAYAVLPPVADKWKRMGFGPRNALGYPTSPLSGEKTASTGTRYRFQQFEGGALEWHLSEPHKDSVFEVRGAIHTKWAMVRYADWSGGLPVADETSAWSQGGSGRQSRFERGQIWWKHNTPEAFTTQPPISQLYLQLGGSGSWLGFPTSEPRDGADGSSRQEFERGYIEVASGQAPRATRTDCAFKLSKQTIAAPPQGLVLETIRVAASRGCTLEVASNVPWIQRLQVTQPPIAVVQFSVSANTGSSGRTGTLTIGNQPVPVSQAGTAPRK